MKVIIYLLLICTFISCGTRKENLNEQKNIHEEQTLQLIESTVVGLTVWDSIGAKLKREQVYKITILSKPDSSGVQYPVSVEEGTVTDEWEGNHLLKSDSTALNNTKKSESHNKADTSKTQFKTIKDNRIVPIWWWLLIGGIVAVLLAWRAKKRK